MHPITCSQDATYQSILLRREADFRYHVDYYQLYLSLSLSLSLPFNLVSELVILVNNVISDTGNGLLYEGARSSALSPSLIITADHCITAIHYNITANYNTDLSLTPEYSFNFSFISGHLCRYICPILVTCLY